jgi:hypothetical protein
MGIRVPDVVWASDEFMAAYGEITPYMRAPEIRYFAGSGEQATTGFPVAVALPPPIK